MTRRWIFETVSGEEGEGEVVTPTCGSLGKKNHRRNSTRREKEEEVEEEEKEEEGGPSIEFFLMTVSKNGTPRHKRGERGEYPNFFFRNWRVIAS